MRSSGGGRGVVPAGIEGVDTTAPVRAGTPHPRILWVTEEPPDRLLGGGNIRQAYLFEALARAFSTDLLVIGEVSDERVRQAAASLIEVPAPSPGVIDRGAGPRLQALAGMLGSLDPQRILPARGSRRALKRRLDQLAGRYDLICVEHAALAPLLPATRACPWVITLHHLLSGMVARELELAPGRRQRVFRTVDLFKAERLERRALERCDCCLVCSDGDAAALRARVGTGAAERVRVVPNGVDLAIYAPTPLPSEPTVLLSGTLGWTPNVDGATWFCTEVWPRVVARVPAARLTLAGRSPVPEVTRLARPPGISLAADVPSMVPYVRAARVIVVPLRIGTGTRLKALEGMAAGRPVVGTTIGLEGLGAVDGRDMLIADDAIAMAGALVELLTSDERATSLAAAGRAHVEQHFGWDAIGRTFLATLAELLKSQPPGGNDARRSSSSA